MPRASLPPALDREGAALREIEGFLAEAKARGAAMAESTFGVRARNYPRLVANLRAGKSVDRETLAATLHYIETIRRAWARKAAKTPRKKARAKRRESV